MKKLADGPIDYEKLRLDVLKNLADDRDITCKQTKEEIIKFLKLDDEDKYIRETTYVKDGDGYIIGIDIKNQKQLIEMGKLVEKREAKNLNRYASNRVHFWGPNKLI